MSINSTGARGMILAPFLLIHLTKVEYAALERTDQTGSPLVAEVLLTMFLKGDGVAFVSMVCKKRV